MSEILVCALNVAKSFFKMYSFKYTFIPRVGGLLITVI